MQQYSTRENMRMVNVWGETVWKANIMQVILTTASNTEPCTSLLNMRMNQLYSVCFNTSVFLRKPLGSSVHLEFSDVC